jgi:uncharacterized protein YndB with AHSA1/START domain
MIQEPPFLLDTATIFAPASRHELLDIHASVLIEAEYRRILYALTMPEYMEAWLRFPGAEKVDCRAETRSLRNFRIHVEGASVRHRTIYGSCFISRPNTITYLWDRTRMGSIAKSIVRMQLRAGSRRCALELSHSGACEKTQQESYRMMWRDSLDALRSLMESTSAKMRPRVQQHQRESEKTNGRL